MDGHSLLDVLKAIADNKSLELFQSIAKGSVESEILKDKKGMSKKQFYMRTKQMLNTGIIKRVKGKFSLTNFGLIVYHGQTVMEKGVNNFWKLKAIDSIQESGQIGEHERMKLIKTILNDNAIENILVTQK
jgi:predicted transcriptional regulator